MAKYITLVKFTSKGIEKVKESPERLEVVKEICKSMDVNLEGFYLTMGRYDAVYIFDAPSPETITKCLLSISSKGAITTETLLAFPEEGYRNIISELP